MRRPISWPYWVLVIILVVTNGYLLVTQAVPYYVLRALKRATRGTLSVYDARVSFPVSLTLNQLRLHTDTPYTALTARRVVLRPRAVSLLSQTVWLEAVDVEQPVLRVSRTASGTWVWPSRLLAGDLRTALGLPRSWRVEIDAVRITEGTIELIDERPPGAFHGVLDHLAVAAGPVATPLADHEVSFAVHGNFVGAMGSSAPLYCSGWVGWLGGNGEASCRLEPLSVTAFEPYYRRQGRLQVRVYQTTLASTSQWVVRADQLDGRVQLELSNFSEGDISVRGTTIFDFKRLARGADPRLRAELKISGPTSGPLPSWRVDFLPGDLQVQQLVQTLLKRGVAMVTIPVEGGKLGISLASSSIETMSEIAKTSREIAEALEILAAPSEPEPPPLVQPPTEPPPATMAPAASSPPAEAVSPPPTTAPALSPEPPAPTMSPAVVPESPPADSPPSGGPAVVPAPSTVR